jgi:predicted nucleic acid-binding protein
MRVLFDTSVLVAAVVQAHPHHERALPWLQRAHSGEAEFLVSSPTLAELYSVLSSLPVKPRISPANAWRLIQENVAAVARFVSLSPADYSEVLRRSAERELSGGVIYDALIARAAEISKVERLLTFNLRDFRRVWPEGESLLLAP